MACQVVITRAARVQFNAIRARITEAASDAVADSFCSGLLSRLESLQDFPEQGTRRDDLAPGLRTFGFRGRVTIAFAVRSDIVSVLGFFYGGQNLGSHFAR